MTTFRPPFIRPATPADAAALSALAAQTFRETYLPHDDPVDVEAYISENYGVERLAAELEGAGSLTYLAFHDDEVVGFLSLRPGSTTPAVTDPRPIQLQRIYVVAQRQGQGEGAALMQLALDEGRRLGHRTIWLSLWDQNRRALAFYRKWGFRHIGTRLFRFGGQEFEDPVMARACQADRITLPGRPGPSG